MYFSRLFFLALEFFFWQIVIFQEWKFFINIREWPSSALRKKNRSWLSEYIPWHIITSQYMEHVWWRKWWIRLNIKWLYLVFWSICLVISSLWNEREKHINTDYSMTACMLCVIPHIMVDVFKNALNKHHIQVNNLIKTFFLDQLKKRYMELLIRSGANINISIKKMILLTEMNLYGILKILVMVTVIYGIRNTHYHPPKFLVL